MTAWFVDAAIWLGILLTIGFFILCQDFNDEVFIMSVKKFVIIHVYGSDKYYFNGLGEYESRVKRWAMDRSLAMEFDTKIEAEDYCRTNGIVGADTE